MNKKVIGDLITDGDRNIPPHVTVKKNSYALRRTINGKFLSYYSTDLDYIRKCNEQLDNGIIPEKREKGVCYSNGELNKRFSDGKEIWKWIPGYEGLYAVSDYGNVISFSKNLSGRKISMKNSSGGYFCFVLYDRSKNKSTISVHKAVMRAFVGECPDGYEIHHKDGNKQNNVLSNLEYITPKEHNKITLSRNPHMLDGMHSAKRTGGKGIVQQYSQGGELLGEFNSGMEAQRITGVKSQNIWQVINKTPLNKKGKTRKRAGGYIWKLKEEGEVV